MTARPGPTVCRGRCRCWVLTAFSIGLAAVAVATSVLSYAGIHAVAQQGGIQARYARAYPLLIDALLIILLAAVLALRGAGLLSRILSWLALLVLLGAAAGAEALHATGRTLPRDVAAITAQPPGRPPRESRAAWQPVPPGRRCPSRRMRAALRRTLTQQN